MNRKVSDAKHIVWLVERDGSLNAATVVHINGRLDEKVLRNALVLLQKRHAILRTRIDYTGGMTPLSPEADQIAPIPLRVEARLNSDHWQDEAESELLAPLAWIPASLLRVVLLQSRQDSEIILTLHRVLNDGASSMYLTRDLLSLVLQMVKGCDNPRLHMFPERKMLDDLPCQSSKVMNGLLQTTASMAEQISGLLIRPASETADCPPVASEPPVPGDAIHRTGCARLLHYVLSDEETQAFVKRCEQEGAAVHDTLVAAVIQAAGQHGCHSSVAHPGMIRCVSSNRLRRSPTEFAGEEIGLFTLRSVAPHQASQPTVFWDMARQAQTAVPEAVSYGETLVALTLPHEITRWMAQPYTQAIFVSNVGHTDMPNRYRSIILQERRTSDAWHGMTDCFGVMVSWINKRLALSFHYPEATLSDDQAGLLGTRVVSVLRSVVNPD